MTLDDVINFITGCEDDKACEAIKRAAEKRARDIQRAAYQAEVDAYWKKTIWWKQGQKLYCAATGTFFGGPMQRGDSGTIYTIQPRKKMVWLTVGTRTVGFSAREVYRYKLQADPPANPMSADERKMLEETVSRVASVL